MIKEGKTAVSHQSCWSSHWYLLYQDTEHYLGIDTITSNLMKINNNNNNNMYVA